MTAASLASFPIGAGPLDAPVRFDTSYVVVSDKDDQVMARDAQKFIDAVATRGIGFLSSGKMSQVEQKKSFRGLLRDSFDLATIGRFSLGKYWRAANPSQRSEYQRLFEDMLVDVYTARFGSYNGQKMVTISSQVVDANDVMVASQIIPVDGSSPINIDWRVRLTDGRYKIVDVMVEGISMAVTQRADFGAVIDRGGGDVAVLINHLKNGRKG